MSLRAPDRTAPPAAELSFVRTVDRTLLHRRHLTEVFLTDAARTGADTFAAAALLPAVHPHYTAHVAAAARALDPMLLVEACRQAETYAAHVFFGVEPDASFVLRGWSARMPGEAAAALAAADGPRELHIAAVTADRVVVGGRVRGMSYDFAARIGAVEVARVSMRVGYLAPAAYAAVRGRGRDRPPPWSDRIAPVAGRPLPPARVGRLRATDVVLSDPAVTPDAVTAVLRVPTENPSLFDHPYDHVPGTVLLEAGRQLAVLAQDAWSGRSPDRTTMVTMDASFAAYTELDRRTVLTATPDGPGRTTVTADQDGARTAQLTVGVAAVPVRPRQAREAT